MTHLPQPVVAIDVSDWFLDQAQGLRGVDLWGWWCFAVSQPVQDIENVSFGGHPGLQRQFYRNVSTKMRQPDREISLAQ
jgi:hypothetical protein